MSEFRNITIAVPDAIYLKARVWAAEHDTSISAVVAYLLATLPNHKRAAQQFPASTSANPVSSANPRSSRLPSPYSPFPSR
jgi:hypothetical protein